MMKYILLTAIILLLVCPVANAAFITWQGGSGDWNDPSKWSSGTVPGAADEVYIGNGSVEITNGYIAEAKGLRVYNDSDLSITVSGILIVNGNNVANPILNGVNVGGTLSIDGRLKIQGVPLGTALGTGPDGDIHIGANGILNVLDSGSNGISNASSFVNNGFIYIRNTGNHGIFNTGEFTNTGKLSMKNINSAGFTCWPGGTFYNYGEFNVKGAASGISAFGNNNLIVNGVDGDMYLSYANNPINMGTGNNSTFYNHGYINATWANGDNGLILWNAFHNRESGILELDRLNTGIRVFTGGALSNTGTILIKENIQDYAINNGDQFYNLACGKITIDAAIANNTGAYFNNEGELYNNSNSTISYNNGSFVNNGLIEDNPGTLVAIVTNEEVIATALTGSVQEGVPVNNVLELNNLDHYIFRGCYTSANLNASAGWYNPGQNTWTPNAAAVGLTAVYLQAAYRVNFSTLCTTVIKIEIPGGVQSFSAPSTFGQQLNDAIAQHKTLIYPNPFQHHFQLQPSSNMEGPYELSLYSATGQQLMQQTLSLASGETISPRLPSLPPGTYWLTLHKDGHLAWSDKLVKLP